MATKVPNKISKQALTEIAIKTMSKTFSIL